MVGQRSPLGPWKKGRKHSQTRETMKEHGRTLAKNNNGVEKKGKNMNDKVGNMGEHLGNFWGKNGQKERK